MTRWRCAVRGLRRSALPIAALAVFAGCATMQNTPQQDRVWAAGRICDQRFRDWRLDRVDPDGSYHVRAITANMIGGDWSQYVACMNTQYRAVVESERTRAKAEAEPALAPPTGAGAARPILGVIAKPAWAVGDEWSYRWESPRGKGTFVWIVDRFDTIEGTDAVVVRSGSREIFYRREDGAHLLDKVDGTVVIRNVPPVTLIRFPVQTGGKWALEYTREQPLVRQTDDMLLDCRADPAETVTVPAGTFAALHVACFHRRGGSLSFEVWHAPEVGNSVKERTVFSYGMRVRELVKFRYQARSTGDAVSLEARDPAHQDYLRTAREQIRSRWIPAGRH
jgi:hypothetical protein